jgi:hypothetical protein
MRTQQRIPRRAIQHPRGTPLVLFRLVEDGRAAGSTLHYQRNRPEQSFLYRIVAPYCPAFVEQMAVQG